MAQIIKQQQAIKNKIADGTIKIPMPLYESYSNAHHLSTNETAALFKTSIQNGLCEEEINKRHIAYGYNRLITKKEKTALQVLLQQFTGVAVYLLLGAAFISLLLNDVAEAVAIIIVILLNAAIGFFMEWQALTSLKALKNLDVIKAKVVRNSRLIEVSSEEITTGDIIYIEAGDIISADARIVLCHHLQSEESALTGESLPVLKHINPLPLHTIVAERKNMLYKGTTATHGSAYAVVTAISDNTELGKISTLVQKAKPDATPLEKQLQSLSKNLVWITLFIAVIIYIIGITKGNGYLLMLETAIAMAVAAIPEGLPIVATITLARGVLRMSKKNVIIKQLPAVETLGKTDVILTDKTGTLTQNRITADTIITARSSYDTVLLTDDDLNDKHALYWLHAVAALCNNASVHEDVKIGDPLEIALLEWVNNSYPPNKIIKRYTKLDEVPFSAETKCMATLHSARHKYIISAKGAAENLLHYCTHELTGTQLRILSSERRNVWLQKNDTLSAQGYRVLGFAYNKAEEKSAGNFMHDLIFLGLIAFSDPPQKNIIHAIQTCKKAGIKTVMITGDHPSTARHIAQQLELCDMNCKVISGKDIEAIDQLSAKEIKELLKTSVFARVTPEQKFDIVSLYQKEGHIVAMTGDGINDAPALKKADVGIAMGDRGTQIAKEAADIVLTDDSFNSIEAAIEQGRIIFENIQKSVMYLLSCNLSEVLIIAAITFIYYASPLTPLQILYMNLVTDVLPALALGMNKGNAAIMQQHPHKHHNIISVKEWKAIITYSLVITICIFCGYAYSTGYLNFPKPVASNMLFWTLALAQLWHSFNLSNGDTLIFKSEVFRNKHVWLALVTCLLIMLATYFLTPLRNVFALVSLSVSQLVIILVSSLLPVAVIHVLKKLKLVI
jgi:Ca2+-transporting ATPase